MNDVISTFSQMPNQASKLVYSAGRINSSIRMKLLQFNARSFQPSPQRAFSFEAPQGNPMPPRRHAKRQFYGLGFSSAQIERIYEIKDSPRHRRITLRPGDRIASLCPFPIASG